VTGVSLRWLLRIRFLAVRPSILTSPVSFPVSVLIFDFDGTIADSLHAVVTICNRLAVEFGYPLTSPQELHRLQNLSSREIIRQSKVAAFKLPFLLRRVRLEMNHHIEELQPIAGMPPVLHQLKHQGCRLGIVTSNSSENVNTFLRIHQLEELFDFIDARLTIFGKGPVLRSVLKRYHLDPATVVYVGDETRDIEAARWIGIPIVAVSWGFNSHQALARQQPDFLIQSPDELVQVVEVIGDRP